MNILVTGGAGFVGSHLCEALIDGGHLVTCLDDFSTGSIWNIRHLLDRPQFRLSKGSVLDKQLLDKLIGESEIVYHLAAQVHVDRSYVEPELTWDVNVKGTQNVLELSRWHRIKKIIFASSSEVYGSSRVEEMTEDHPLDAPHPYGASKTAADRMCFAYSKTFKMPVVIVRCFNIFGPRQKDFGYGGVISLFMRKAIRGEPLVIFGDGTQSRDYTFVSDVIDFYERVMVRSVDVGPFNVGTGYCATINCLAEDINNLCGMKSLIVHGPPRPSEVIRLCSKSDKARAETDWTPKVTLHAGLSKLKEWFLQNGTDPR